MVRNEEIAVRNGRKVSPTCSLVRRGAELRIVPVLKSPVSTVDVQTTTPAAIRRDGRRWTTIESPPALLPRRWCPRPQLSSLACCRCWRACAHDAAAPCATANGRDAQGVAPAARSSSTPGCPTRRAWSSAERPRVSVAFTSVPSAASSTRIVSRCPWPCAASVSGARGRAPLACAACSQSARSSHSRARRGGRHVADELRGDRRVVVVARDEQRRHALDGGALTSAPRAISSNATSAAPASHATYSAVRPAALGASTAAPRSSSSRTTDRWPRSLAYRSGRHP